MLQCFVSWAFRVTRGDGGIFMGSRSYWSELVPPLSSDLIAQAIRRGHSFTKPCLFSTTALRPQTFLTPIHRLQAYASKSKYRNLRLPPALDHACATRLRSTPAFCRLYSVPFCPTTRRGRHVNLSFVAQRLAPHLQC